MKRISFTKMEKGERAMAEARTRVHIAGCYGHLVRVIRDAKYKVTHLDVEVNGVIDRYCVNQLQEYKSDE